MSDRTTYKGAALAAALLLASCNEQQLQPFVLDDTVPPSVAIVKTVGDTLDVSQGLVFAITAADNLGLKTVGASLTGGLLVGIDTTFTTAVTNITLGVDIQLPEDTPAGGWVYIAATATDGADNGATASDSIFLLNESALTVEIINPADGAVTSTGKQLPVDIRAQQRDGVRWVGYLVSGVVTGGDSIGPLNSLPADTTFVDTLTVPTTASEGTFTIVGFALDSASRRVTTAPITVTVQSAASDNTPPTVTFQVADRVEVDDSITVNATDPSGITKLGWLAQLLDGTIVGGDSIDYGNADFTDRTEKWRLRFTFTTLPQTVVFTAFAEDGASPPNRGTSTGSQAPAANGPARAAALQADTVLVVHGITKPLPDGGRIADAIYNRNLDEIYLTNVLLDQVEVFRVTDTTFDDPIPVGSRPWGIALWPADTASGALRNNEDMVVVANSGGTNLSIVDVSNTATHIAGERRRHHLPNFLLETVTTEIDPVNSTLKIAVVEYDFSDRPQYLGMTCRPTTATSQCAPDSIIAIYSTSPTLAQADRPKDFVNRGTVRWENITADLGTGPQSHFFWEQAAVAPSPEADTIQIIVDRGPGTAPDTVLSAACGITATTVELAFLDTTFVRNSGDFTHALVGEGGIGEPPSRFARAIGWNATTGMATATCSMSLLGVSFSGRIERDLGISPSIRVRDIVVNTAIGVNSIALNFNGLTNLVRADSIYVLDEGLRLQGLMQVSGVNPGMDLNFDHAFDARDRGTLDPTDPNDFATYDPVRNDRLLFAATPNPQIDVFDTYFYGKVASVPIKDPVIGPLRVARLPTGEQVLVGVTVNGIVVAKLPAITNTFPVEGWGAPSVP